MNISTVFKFFICTSTLFLPLSSVEAAEIYNRDSNKLDLYGRITAKHLFSKDREANSDVSYVRLGFRGETQLSDSLTGFGQWEYNVQADKDEEHSTEGTKTRLGFAGIKFNNVASIDYGRNFGLLFDAES